LQKDDTVINTDGSKARDKDFYETAMKEYNKKNLDEYNTLHFATDIVVVDAKNLPTEFTPIKDWRNLKKVFNKTMAELTRSINAQCYPDAMEVTVREKPTPTLSPSPRSQRRTFNTGISLPTKTQNDSKI
jgi:hypothetical protein